MQRQKVKCSELIIISVFMLLCGCAQSDHGNDWMRKMPIESPRGARVYRQAVYAVAELRSQEAIKLLRDSSMITGSCAGFLQFSDAGEKLSGMCSLVRAVDCGGDARVSWVGDTLDVLDYKLGEIGGVKKRAVIVEGVPRAVFSYCSGAN
jgi:hypothetical protein